MTDPEKIIIHKSKNNLYSINNLDIAAKRLTSNGGFKLYMFFISRQDDYPFNFTVQDFLEWSSLEESDFDNALNELVKEEFLVQDKNDKDNFIFSDTPKQNDDF